MGVRSFEPARIKSWEERDRARKAAYARAQIMRIVGSSIIGFVLGVTLMAIFGSLAHATWKREYADASPAVRDWYQNAQLTPAAQARFTFKGCCDHADVVKSKFRVGVKGQDVWEFLDTAASPPAWREIPADIIHWGEYAPDGQPTLFRLGENGALVCFYPGQDGN